MSVLTETTITAASVVGGRVTLIVSSIRVTSVLIVAILSHWATAIALLVIAAELVIVTPASTAAGLTAHIALRIRIALIVAKAVAASILIPWATALIILPRCLLTIGTPVSIISIEVCVAAVATATAISAHVVSPIVIVCVAIVATPAAPIAAIVSDAALISKAAATLAIASTSTAYSLAIHFGFGQGFLHVQRFILDRV